MNDQDSSDVIVDNTILSSDGSFSEESLHGHESGPDQALVQSNASESSDNEIMCKDRSRHSPTSSVRNSCVKLGASDSNDKKNKDVGGNSKGGTKDTLNH